MNKLSTISLAIVLAIMSSCNSARSYSLCEENDRKISIYKYAGSLFQEDLNSTTMGAMQLRNHPLYLKEPYPTQADMEAVIGKADFSQMEKWTTTMTDQNETLTLYWWERDKTWETPTAKGKKKGYREIIIAHFDENGRLRMVDVNQCVGFEVIGRIPSEWSMMSSL